MGSQGNLAGSGVGLSAHLNGENGGCAEESPVTMEPGYGFFLRHKAEVILP